MTYYFEYYNGRDMWTDRAIRFRNVTFVNFDTVGLTRHGRFRNINKG